MLTGKGALGRWAALALGASAVACGGAGPSTTPDASTGSDAGGSDAAEAGPVVDSGAGDGASDASLDASDASACATACPAPDACHTQGSCDPATKTCTNPPKPDGTACNDGNACTQTDVCTAGACTGENPVMCSPSDSCHVAGTCDMATGQCGNPAAPDGTGCDDGNACTRSDACMTGVCTGSDPVVCTPLDQCHVTGTCDTATGNCDNPDATDGTACNDDDACTQTDACMSGTCTGSNPVVCAPLDQCHVAGS